MGYFLSLSKETAEHWLNASELTLLVCGLVLAYGAAGEYLDDHGKLPRWMRWAREPKLVFVWMVAISLFGEFAGDAGVYTFSGQLQTISDTELAQLKKENLTLQGQVGDATKAVIKAQGAADGAVADLKQVEGRVTTLNEGLDGAQNTVEVVGKEADVVEYVLSARRVRDEDGLKKDFEQQFKGESIVFKSYAAAPDGQESFWLCSQLADIAHKAGVNSIDACATEQLPRLPSNDLLISAPTHEEAEPLARLLMKPKRVAGYFVGMNQATPQLTVLIGIKESLPLWPDVEKEAFKAAANKKKVKP